MAKRIENFFAGAVSGLVATVPMTAVLIAVKHLFPKKNRTPLPPVQITQNALHAIGVDHVPKQKHAALTTLNHFGFGASTGGVFGSCCQRHSVLETMASGGIYGLGVWTLSYLGWLPGSGLYRNAVRETAQRNSLMITAHLVWGVSLGLGTYCCSKLCGDVSPKARAGIDPGQRSPGRWSPGDQDDS